MPSSMLLSDINAKKTKETGVSKPVRCTILEGLRHVKATYNCHT